MAFKTNDDRLDSVLSFIGAHFKQSENLMQQLMDGLGTQKTQIANALSLGARDNDKSAAGTERRNGVRVLLFLAFTEGKQPLALADMFKTKYLAMDLQQIKSQIQQRLPLYDSSNRLRVSWGPTTFTRPTADPLQIAPATFRYHIFGMMNVTTKRGMTYDAILNNPAVLRTMMLSTTIINETHRATYYPYGFIISAPRENILSTHTSDQAFKNYSSNEFIGLVQRNDRREEMMRVSGQYPFKTPDQVLAGTTGANGETGYNEVTVLGTAPPNKAIDIVGMFMKVDSAGQRYTRLNAPAPFVSDSILDLMKATKLPIVKITDPSGSTH